MRLHSSLQRRTLKYNSTITKTGTLLFFAEPVKGEWEPTHEKKKHVRSVRYTVSALDDVFVVLFLLLFCHLLCWAVPLRLPGLGD